MRERRSMARQLLHIRRCGVWRFVLGLVVLGVSACSSQQRLGKIVVDYEGDTARLDALLAENREQASLDEKKSLIRSFSGIDGQTRKMMRDLLMVDARRAFALKSITMGVHQGRACYFKAEFQDVLDPSKILTSNEISWCDFMGGGVGGGADSGFGHTVEPSLEPYFSHVETVHVSATADDGVVTANALQVCTLDSHGIGGVRLIGRALNADTRQGSRDEKVLGQCERWASESACPAGSFISAVDVAFQPVPVKGDEGSTQGNALIAVGLSPLCRRLSVDSVAQVEL